MSERSGLHLRRRFRVLASVAAATLGVANVCVADTWTNASGDGLWDTPSNWGDGTIPTPSDPVQLSPTAPGSRVITLHPEADGGPTLGQFVQAFDSYTLQGGALALASPTFIVTTGKTLTLNSRLASNTGVRSGAGGVSTGTLVLGADNRGSLSGVATIMESPLRITSPFNLGDVSSVSIGDPVFFSSTTASLVLDGSMTFGIPITFASTQAAALGAVDVTAGNTVTFPNAMPRFNKGAGGGTAVLTAPGLASGRVVGGTLRVEGAPDPSGTTIEMRGGVLELVGQRLASAVAPPTDSSLAGDFTLRGIGTATFAGSITAPGQHTLTIDTGGDSTARLTLTRILAAGTNAAVRYTGAGTIIFPDAGARGLATIDGTTVVATNVSGTAGSATAPLVIKNGGVLELLAPGATAAVFGQVVRLEDGGTLRVGRPLTWSAGTGNAPLIVAPAAQVTLQTNAASDLLSVSNTGVTGGSGGAQIRVTGPARVALSAAGTYQGKWLVDNGWLLVRNAAALGTGTTPIQVGTAAGQPALLEAINVKIDRPVMLYDGGELRSGNGTGAGTNAMTTFAGTISVRPGASVRFSTRDPGDVLTIGDSENDLTGGGGGAMVHVSGPGKVVLADGSNLVAGWSIDSGTAYVAGQLGGNGNLAGPSVVESLDVNVGAGARLDLYGSILAVRNGDVGEPVGGVYDGLSGLLQSGHNGGSWDGEGIVTSLAGAATGLKSIGIMRAVDNGGYPDFPGVILQADDVLIMPTWGGDANLDRLVSGDDYAAIDFAIAVPGASGWANGDFNWDGIISGDDYATIDFNIVAQYGPSATTSSLGVVAVPEPTMTTVAAFAASLLCARRRRGGAALP